ncbi:hypothetical protein B5S28_g4371 [[Candida] boidinii]|uniref:Unnamed protein product n=1 Tax=Candida boidinii TaxID=5477 RepID=A0ACB5TN02_CANBO|nr:hypothetical protein B5S28_g4371 [[Candida] boidinii]OWB61946.1 hypothetical protein B5S29_g2853 [[Candida] boidinii]OWB72838.1 hypothetical protein B5S31_g2561 [[Candida] boidinii]OWB80597.1 hypothetical protein B5S32_g4885 [[Candida] boidinii]GME91448.1 unnamed protein product [[Candida] boidinii]
MSKVFTAEEVAAHNTRSDLYIVVDGKVYDCSEYLDEHPGGEEVIIDCAGDDATEAFEDIGHSEDAREILEGLLVGTVEGGFKSTKQATATSEGGSSLPLVAAAGIAIAVCAFFFLRQN